MSFTSAGSTDATIVVAIGEGGRSRRAVRWAAEHLIPQAHRVLLVHVIASVSSIPSPSGVRVPIEKLETEVVNLYVQDLKSKAQQVFYPFKRLCRSKNVETLVLDGKNRVDALLRFLSVSGTKNLVMGCSSFGWIRRILKSPDMPMSILKSAPDSCNIFLVSRRKLTMRLASQSLIGGPGVNVQIKKLNLEAFTRKNTQTSVNDEMLGSLVLSGVDTCSQIHVDDNASFLSGGSSEIASVLSFTTHHTGNSLGKRILEFQTLKNYDYVAPYRDLPCFIGNSMKEVDVPDELAGLRQELQNTLAMYKKACDDLVRAKKKVEVLSAEYSKESKKVKDALAREEVLRQIAVEEKARHLQAIKEVEEARKLLAEEAQNRLKAEVAAKNMSSEKFEVLFSNGKGCRRYSKNEIELATDNFSDARKIGEGGYGKVYKCNIDHTPVAVKVLHQDAYNKSDEFIREVEVLSQLRHPHMVLLLGGCPEIGCLVYEFMENRSLDNQLFCNGSAPLPWFIRFRIIFEVACGLSFLHGTKPDPIVHRDLKPGNILLDRNFGSKIGDVGMAKLMYKLVPDDFTEYRDTILAGTLYYMDPEYQRTGTVRPKSDVYSLGIIALQLLTARHPRGLLLDVERAIESRSLTNLLDRSVSDWPLVEAEKLARLALKCSRLRCRDRPDLESEVLPQLEELAHMANVCFKLRQYDVQTPSHFFCPILQGIMDNPYIAADGYTYEYRAIKAWLEIQSVSPVTKLRLPHTRIIPNYSLRSAIQAWKSSSALTAR